MKFKKTKFQTETFEVTGTKREIHGGKKEYLMLDVVNKGDNRYEAFIYYPSEDLKMSVLAAEDDHDTFLENVKNILLAGDKTKEYVKDYLEKFCFY